MYFIERTSVKKLKFVIQRFGLELDRYIFYFKYYFYIFFKFIDKDDKIMFIIFDLF